MPEYRPSEREYDTVLRNAVKNNRRLPQIGSTPEDLEVEFANKHKAMLFNIPGFPGLGDNGSPDTPSDNIEANMPYPFHYTPLLFFEDIGPRQIQIEKDDMLTFLPLVLGIIF